MRMIKRTASQGPSWTVFSTGGVMIPPSQTTHLLTSRKYARMAVPRCGKNYMVIFQKVARYLFHLQTSIAFKCMCLTNEIFNDIDWCKIDHQNNTKIFVIPVRKMSVKETKKLLSEIVKRYKVEIDLNTSKDIKIN
jgi:hypothetical protein